MIPTKITQVAKEIDGTLTYEIGDYVSGVAIDSRKVKKGDLFFALKGSITDGHRYLADAVNNGAAALVVSEMDDTLGTVQIIVEDTFKAIQQFAGAYISRFKIPFIAVTGSSGKTTTKDMLAAVLSRKYKTMKTPGNLNSSTGALLTLFELDETHEMAVVELSMSMPGEILANAQIIKPTCALITNIGTAHLEYLGSREAIFKAKCEIFEYFEKDDLLIINNDDDLLFSLKSDLFEIIRTGIDSGELQALNIRFDAGISRFDVMIDGELTEFSFPFSGLHFVSNCLLVIAVALKYSLSILQIQEGFDSYSPGLNRMQVTEVNGIKLINDTYNANPNSMKASIDSLCLMAKDRKIAILGDMFELGESARELTEQVGEYAAENGVDVLYVVGQLAVSYIDGYRKVREDGEVECFDNKETLSKKIISILKPSDTVLFKASRSMQLEESFDMVKELVL